MTGDKRDLPAQRAWSAWRTIALVAMALLGTAVLIALILTLSDANRQRDSALGRQGHSFDVMILARTLAGEIATSEALLGRYVISGGDRQIGELYRTQRQRAASELARLATIAGDDADQHMRIGHLRAAYDAREHELAAITISADPALTRQAYARYHDASTAPSLARVDAVLGEIIKRERSVLDQRTATAMTAVDRSSRVAGILAIFGVLFILKVILLVWLTLKTVRERGTARAEADAAQERATELALAVTKATDELRIQEAKLHQAQKMDALGQLTGGIAHDFNNMLAVVLGGLELARRNVGDPAAACRHIDSARDGADRAATLTRRLLTFSREESLQPEPLAAGPLVKGMSELFDRTLGDSITVTTGDDSDGWRVCADRLQLENAILNLAVNARDAMHGRGTLAITVARTTLDEHEVGTCAAGDHLSIAVTDDGEGMPPEILDRVFEPFFTTKPVGKGTGLGLSQVFALMRQLDGAIGIVSAPGKGTTVTLYIPREAAAARPPEAMNDTAPHEPPSDPTALRVLIVEDDPRVLAASSAALTELGHHAVPCDDPFAAAGLIDRHAIDLILSDVLMPRQTGPEMIASLGDRVADIAVLFVTGFAGEVNASEFGDHGVLRKPFTLAGLEAAIAVAIAQRGAADHQIAAE